MAEREQSRGVEARRGQLQGECHAVIQAGTQAIDALKAQDQGEFSGWNGWSSVSLSASRPGAQPPASVAEPAPAMPHVLAGAQAVRHGECRLPLAERVLSLRSAQVGAWRQQVQRLTQCQAAERMVQQKLSGIEREAGQAALKAEELARRFALTGEVPCAGTDLQGQCKLLGDAREAKALIPSAQGTIKRLGREKASGTARTGRLARTA
jgi:exonuclease SbcC